MSIESEIQSEVEALKARFSETKALYREVCTLLFFRYGITPTASKLYQYVRKGSMSAPAEALGKFWEELRTKARIEIDHPDLPQALKASAAEAIAELWRQASAGARDELAALRLEVQAQLDAAQAAALQARRATEDLQDQLATARTQFASAVEATHQVQTELESERRAHTAAVARLQELQRHFDEAQAQQERMRADFSAELGKAREAVESANLRADASDRRALLEIEQERQARVKADRQVEALRTQLNQAETRAREGEHEHAGALARVQAQLDSAVAANRSCSEARDRTSADLAATRAELEAAQQEVLGLRVETRTVRELLERLTPGMTASDAGKSGKARRRAG